MSVHLIHMRVAAQGFVVGAMTCGNYPVFPLFLGTETPCDQKQTLNPKHFDALDFKSCRSYKIFGLTFYLLKKIKITALS